MMPAAIGSSPDDSKPQAAFRARRRVMFCKVRSVRASDRVTVLESPSRVHMLTAQAAGSTSTVTGSCFPSPCHAAHSKAWRACPTEIALHLIVGYSGWQIAR